MGGHWIEFQGCSLCLLDDDASYFKKCRRVVFYTMSTAHQCSVYIDCVRNLITNYDSVNCLSTLDGRMLCDDSIFEVADALHKATIGCRISNLNRPTKFTINSLGTNYVYVLGGYLEIFWIHLWCYHQN